MARAGAFEAVVFDLDGTLVDTLPDIDEALNRVLAEAGRARVAAAETRLMIGEGARRLVARGFERTGAALGEAELDAACARFVAAYEARPAAASRPFPGAEACLGALAANGIALAVCTNKPERLTRMVLDALGLARYFAGVVGGDTLAERKPAAGPVLAALAGIGATPARAAMVGDSPTDAAAARAAGLAFLAVTFGYSRVPAAALGADALVERLEALPVALERLARAIPRGARRDSVNDIQTDGT